MRRLLFTVFVILSGYLSAQDRYYSPPVKIPILLSGSFAELRSNHFHSGIDIKTQGTTGLPVYAAASGYISRIVVSPAGYGRALYINHPNGTTTVYGHLKKFRDDIEQFVTERQYNAESFRIDLQLIPGTFTVNKDEIIALSGNTGSSGGPHLHFEIRNTKTEQPQNPLPIDIPVEDHIPPKIFSVLIVPLSPQSHVNYQSSKTSFPVQLHDGKYVINGKNPIPVYGEIGFAVQANDYFDGSWNKCGINSLELTVNDELYFTYEMDKFGFQESRYINSQIVYDEYILSNRKYLKAWKDPGNKLTAYPYIKEDGSLTTSVEEEYMIRLQLKDSYGNRSVLEFSVKAYQMKGIQASLKPVKKFSYRKENHYLTDSFRIDLSAGTLYKDLDFQYNHHSSRGIFFSGIHEIHDESVPLHNSVSVKIKPDRIPARLSTKILLVKIDPETGEHYTAGGSYKKGWVTGNVNSFGSYAVSADTVPPEVTPLSITGDSTLNEKHRIRFKIEDDLSGIKNIRGTLNGKWMLFDYDPKRQMITHYFDRSRFDFNKQQHFVLEVTDYKNNTTSYEARFRK